MSASTKTEVLSLEQFKQVKCDHWQIGVEVIGYYLKVYVPVDQKEIIRQIEDRQTHEGVLFSFHLLYHSVYAGGGITICKITLD